MSDSRPSTPPPARKRTFKPRASRPPRDPALNTRLAAVRLLQAVLDDGRALDEPFETETRLLEPRDRAFVRLLVTTTLRRLGQIDGVLKTFLQRPIARRHGVVKHVLRLAAAQILVLDTPAHAAADTSVELTRVLNAPGLTGLVNAVTRRLVREGAARMAEQDIRLNTPRWLWQSWIGAYGEADARRIAEAHLWEPPLDITAKSDAEGWAERLNAEVLPTGSLRRRSPGWSAACRAMTRVHGGFRTPPPLCRLACWETSRERRWLTSAPHRGARPRNWLRLALMSLPWTVLTEGWRACTTTCPAWDSPTV